MRVQALAILDGTVLPAAEAVIGVTDEGLLRGDGVFEVIRVYDGRPFALDEHLARMASSAANLRLELSPADIARDVAALLDAAGPVDAAVRVLVTRGGRRIGLVEALKERPETIALACVEYAPTRLMDAIKSLSYAANMLAGRLAAERGADEALFVTPHGRVLEAPTSSFFYVLGGRLHTPPLEDHILDSITRRHVIAVTGATERVTVGDDLLVLEEAFLASTLREVHPVHAIDERPLGAAPGPVTAGAAEAMSARVRELLAAAP